MSRIVSQVENDCTIVKGKGKNSSASRTLLRLHRALAFITALVQGMAVAPEADSSTTVASAAYSETLSRHHAWLIRKGVQTSFYALSG